MCSNAVQDCFITRSSAFSISADSGKVEYTSDATFATPVWSVSVDPLDPTKAAVTTRETDWLAPRFPGDFDTADLLNPRYDVPYRDLKVGDLIRVGAAHTGGFTDYMTVLEIKTVSHYYNTIGSGVNDFIPFSRGGTNVVGGGASYVVQGSGLAGKIIRVNVKLNATNLPVAPNQIPQNTTHNDAVPTPISVRYHRATNVNNDSGFNYLSNPAAWYTTKTATYPSGDNSMEQFCYPLYVVRAPVVAGPGSELKLDLASSARKLKRLTLQAYSFDLLADAGVQADHMSDPITCGWVAMRIRELQTGTVVSNNLNAHGAFAILSSGSGIDNVNGSRAYRDSAHTEHGISTVEFSTPRILGSLTLELTDRLGRPVKIGQANFWFKAYYAD